MKMYALNAYSGTTFVTTALAIFSPAGFAIPAALRLLWNHRWKNDLAKGGRSCARIWLTKRTEQDKADEEWAKGAKHGALWSIGKHLEERARDKVESYRGQTSTAFKPMVFSVGGAETINEFLDDRAELYLQSYFRYNGIQRIRMYWREQITSVNSKSWAGANLPGGKSLNIIEFEALIAEFNHI
ncbi:hypothetical protein CF328_g8643 [Tilletia controversa]|nr:hypothetical protein CF328_g8643 [Tilletia controversa]